VPIRTNARTVPLVMVPPVPSAAPGGDGGECGAVGVHVGEALAGGVAGPDPVGYLAGCGCPPLHVQHVAAEWGPAAEGLVYADQAGMARAETVPVRPPPSDVR
jgi:hypothetical protein